MKFSVIAFSVTVAAVVISGAVSFIEGTLTSKTVKMGFLNHGGMWGDLLLLSTALGFMFPYITKNLAWIGYSSAISLLVTLYAHAKWAKWMQGEGSTGHIFPAHETGRWYLDLSISGWMHVLVMTMLLSIMLLGLVSSLPVKSVIISSILLTVHGFFATMQPSWYCTEKLWTWRNIGPPAFTAILIWAVAVVKIECAA